MNHCDPPLLVPSATWCLFQTFILTPLTGHSIHHYDFMLVYSQPNYAPRLHRFAWARTTACVHHFIRTPKRLHSQLWALLQYTVYTPLPPAQYFTASTPSLAAWHQCYGNSNFHNSHSGINVASVNIPNHPTTCSGINVASIDSTLCT